MLKVFSTQRILRGRKEVWTHLKIINLSCFLQDNHLSAGGRQDSKFQNSKLKTSWDD